MLTSERKSHLLEVLRRDRRVVAKEVSQALGLSEDTIRRDLRELASEGLLQRVHGGALPASPAVADLEVRSTVSIEGKAAIGRRAARLVQAGQVVILDGGTTMLQLVRFLPVALHLTIVTHSPAIAVALAAHPLADVELIGGRLFRHSMVTVGAVAAEAIARIRADLYFMGVTGVHPELGLTTGDSEEAAIKRAFMGQAGETIVLASREKLGAVSPFRVAPLTDADAIVIESGVEESLTQNYRAAGLSVITA